MHFGVSVRAADEHGRVLRQCCGRIEVGNRTRWSDKVWRVKTDQRGISWIGEIEDEGCFVREKKKREGGMLVNLM